MKRLFFLLIVFSLAACEKKDLVQPPPQEVEMEYKDLLQSEIGYRQFLRLDLDNNGSIDIVFTTYHIGDPLMQMDKIQFCANSYIDCYLPVKADNDVQMLSAGDLIQTRNTESHEWFHISQLVMAQKNIPLTGSVFWSGSWKGANHNYLPFQLDKQGKRYNGWIELSYDMTNEKIILHRAAISKVANVDIKAGH